ncbi:hypothetical protein LTR95_005303, partial [Oleoguttula sp. CCFEE 5521]
MGGGPAKEHLLIAAPQAIPEAIVARLQKKFPDIDVTSIQVNSTSPKLVDVPASTFAKVTILVTFNVLPPDPQRDAPNLDWLHLFSAGSNHIQHHPLYTSSDVTITTSSGIHGPQIAEWAVMTALVQSHKYKQLYELQKEHRWGKTG